MLPPSLDYLAAWFGVVWAGRRRRARQRRLQGRVPPARRRRLGREDPDHRRRAGSNASTASTCPASARSSSPDGARSRRPPARRAPTDDCRGARHAPAPRVRRDEYDLAYLMYTSGTTGPSKGAMHSNRSSLWNVPLLDRHPRSSDGRRRRLLDVPALPRHRALGGRDLGDLGRARRSCCATASRLPASGTTCERARRTYFAVHGRRDPPALGTA